MNECPKCGRPVIEGVVVCDCGHVLKAVFGTEPDRVDEPAIASPGESPRVIRKEPARVSRPPIREDVRKPGWNHWERWLVIFGLLGIFRYMLNWSSNRPLFQPSSPPSGRVADSPLTAGFSLSSATGRFEQLQEGSLELLRKYLTPEENGFMIEMSKKQDQNSATPEELNRVRVLMKKLDSMTTAEEKAKLLELRGVMRRLGGLTR